MPINYTLWTLNFSFGPPEMTIETSHFCCWVKKQYKDQKASISIINEKNLIVDVNKVIISIRNLKNLLAVGHIQKIQFFFFRKPIRLFSYHNHWKVLQKTFKKTKLDTTKPFSKIFTRLMFVSVSQLLAISWLRKLDPDISPDWLMKF